MKLSKTRLSEIENLPEDPIDTSEIAELDDDFWENAEWIVPENCLQIEHEILEWFKKQGQDYHAQPSCQAPGCDRLWFTNRVSGCLPDRL